MRTLLLLFNLINSRAWEIKLYPEANPIRDKDSNTKYKRHYSYKAHPLGKKCKEYINTAHNIVSDCRRHPFRFRIYNDPHDDIECSSFEINHLNNELDRQSRKHFNNDGSNNNTENQFQKNYEPNNSNDKENQQKDIKFTDLSAEAQISYYKKQLKYSKVFNYNPQSNSKINIILVSKRKNYHPQFIFSKKNGKEYIKVNKDSTETDFNIYKGESYVVEVGFDQKLDVKPFPNVASGSFSLLISSETNTIRDIMSKESIKLNTWGHEGVAVFDHNSAIELQNERGAKVNYGYLNYNITPYYNESNNSITIYYNLGKDLFSGDRSSAIEFEIVCNQHADYDKIYYGKEPQKRKYEYKVDSSGICNLTSVL